MKNFTKKLANIMLIILLVITCISTNIFATTYVKNYIWQNDGTYGVTSWGGVYRFALEGTDGNNEAIAQLSEDVWNRIKTETFYLDIQPSSLEPNVRITTGWWQVAWPTPEANVLDPAFGVATENSDGTITIEINFKDHDILNYIDEQHLLFTGTDYTPICLYFLEEKFDDDTEYEISQEVEGDDGSIDIKNISDEPITQARAGEIIYFEANPQDGYQFDYWEVVEGDLNIDSIKNKNPITFRMPVGGVTLKAHFANV